MDGRTGGGATERSGFAFLHLFTHCFRESLLNTNPLLGTLITFTVWGEKHLSRGQSPRTKETTQIFSRSQEEEVVLGLQSQQRVDGERRGHRS